jgi:hypothetical protein
MLEEQITSDEDEEFHDAHQDMTPKAEVKAVARATGRMNGNGGACSGTHRQSGMSSSDTTLNGNASSSTMSTMNSL